MSFLGKDPGACQASPTAEVLASSQALAAGHGTVNRWLTRRVSADMGDKLLMALGVDRRDHKSRPQEIVAGS